MTAALRSLITTAPTSTTVLASGTGQQLHLCIYPLPASTLLQGLVPGVHSLRGRQLLHHHLLRLLLHRRGGLEALIHHRTYRGPRLLRPWLAALRIYGEKIFYIM